MAVSINTVELDFRLLLRGLFESARIQTTQTRLLSGSLVISSRPKSGRILTLTTDGPDNIKYGLFTREQLEAIAALRDTGDTLTLHHNSLSISVIIPDDGISVEPLIESNSMKSTDKYTGTITFIEVV